MSEAQKARSPWYRPRNILFGFLGVFLVGVLFVIWQIAQISAAVPGTNPLAGQQVMELVESYQPEGFRDRSDLPNAYDMLLEAGALVEPINNELRDLIDGDLAQRFLDEDGITLIEVPRWSIYYLWQDPDKIVREGRELSPAQMDELEAYMEEHANLAMKRYDEAGIPDLLTRLAATPRAAREEPTSPLFDMLLPELGRARSLARSAVVSMQLATESDDAERFVGSFEHVLALGRIQMHQSFLIHPIVGYALYNLGFGAVKEPLLGEQFDAETLRSLLGALDRQSATPPLDLAIEGSRLGVLDQIHLAHSDDGRGDGYFLPAAWASSVFGRPLLSLGSAPSPSPRNITGLLLPRKKQTVDQANAIFDYALAVSNATPDQRPSFWPFVAALPKNYAILEDLVPVFDKVFVSRDQHQLQLASLRLWLAIDIYRAEHNAAPPPTLDALVPGYLPALPLDPFAADGLFNYTVLDAPDEHGRVFLLSGGLVGSPINHLQEWDTPAEEAELDEEEPDEEEAGEVEVEEG